MNAIFSFRFDHPVESVWPFVAVPERWLDYTPALVERTSLDSNPWPSIDRIGPIQGDFTDELLELEALRRVVWKHSAPRDSWAEFTVEPDGGSTLLHVDFEGRPSGRIRWMGLMSDSHATTIYRNDMKTLAGVLDRRKSE